MKNHVLRGNERRQLLEELHKKYGAPTTLRQRIVYWRKKYAWLLVVGAANIFKRVLDIVVSLILLVVLAPVMLLIALCIKMEDRGPILYISERVGKWGKEFRLPKFRSMVKGAEKLQDSLRPHSVHKDAGTFKMINDPRVTRVGYVLRRTSLDELPQLWNVAKGEMSLVGPRPPLPAEVSTYTLEDRRRLDVKPGLTCIWQVSGRSQLPFSQQVRLDVQYIESQSLLLDMKLLLKTIPAVIFGKGAF